MTGSVSGTSPCVFGGAISIGIDDAQCVVPGVIVRRAGCGAAGIDGTSVLIDHVATSVMNNMVTTAIVIGAAYVTGFRSDATLADWLAVAGLLVLFILAMS